jgi:hypothetical protein
MGGAYFRGQTSALKPIFKDNGEVPKRPKLQFKENRDKLIPNKECSLLYLNYSGLGCMLP